jgi:hypothetical protein
MLIDTKDIIENLKKSPKTKGIIAGLVQKLGFAKDDQKLSVEERQHLSALVCWLFVVGDDEHVLQLGEVLLQITSGPDKEKWTPIELALSMPWLLAQKRGDAAFVAKCEAKIAEAYTKESPALIKQVNEKVRTRQMNGEHLHDDEIAKAREAKEMWMEIRAMTRQLQRLCWILARGGSERMPKALLEEKIKACRDFLIAHTDAAFSEVYPA